MKNVYYPERLVEMIQTGDVVSVVAVSEVNGEVIAHCDLEFHGRKHGIPEIAMAFAKPKYRGMGCLNSLNDFILDQAQKTGLKGMYAKAVTAHTYFQKALDAFAGVTALETFYKFVILAFSEMPPPPFLILPSLLNL